ncbi:MAG: NAD(P)/FAD-dependent oxidoreductase [Filifactoraceae bacterium]
MIIISNIKLSLDEGIDNLEKCIRNKLRIAPSKNLEYEVLKESIDARKNTITFVYQVLVKNYDKKEVIKLNDKDVTFVEFEFKNNLKKGNIKLKHRPVVIGLGPSGLFAALTLAQNGYNPIIFELGRDVDKRREDVDRFWENGILDETSNVQFGEGGAGTFSDGKLTTRIKDPRVKIVLRELHKHGGPEDITYSHKAHIGTDILKTVVKNIRNEIIDLGGSVNFESKLEDILFKDDGSVKSVVVNGKIIETETIILAVGNSARETYKMLYSNKVSMISKPFAVGFRIEHPRIKIDKSQYKENYDHPKLKSASYNLTYKASNGKSCYTFCMCPGGRVIAATSSLDKVVVNGMSYHDRSDINSNSAILCSVNENDYGKDVLSGIYFQEEIEKKAYILGGGNFIAPVQRVDDFLENKESTYLGEVKPSYTPGYKLSNLNTIYSAEIITALKESIMYYGKKVEAFKMKDAVLTGVETRSSSPVRILRDDTMMSISHFGIFPSGEGAGYSGGIMSSAVDGIKSAEALISNFYI